MQSITPKLLVTDDDAALRQTLAEAFAHRGFDVVVAADGHEALERVNDSRIHLALVDVHMPRLSGLQLISRLRADNLAVPCILMSAALDDAIRTEAERMQVFRLMHKPLRFAELAQAVRQVLAEHYGWAIQG